MVVSKTHIFMIENFHEMTLTHTNEHTIYFFHMTLPTIEGTYFSASHMLKAYLNTLLSFLTCLYSAELE